MTAGVKRRVRVVIEGEAHEVSQKCGVLRIDLPADETGLPAVVMVNPEWEGVTVEDVAPAYNWQDGDAILSKLGNVFVRAGGRWHRHGANTTWTDGVVTREIRDAGKILRYQAGAA